MIVDQDAATRDFCRRVLAGAGYQVQEAIDPSAALNQIARSPPDVIAIDAAAYTVERLAWAHRLRTNPSTCDIPVIMMDAEAAEQGLDLEPYVDEYLDKPLRQRDLVQRVRSMARLRHSRLELGRSRHLRAEQARLWMVLLDLSRSLAGTDNLSAVLRRIVESAAELASSRRVALMLPDKDRRYLTMARAVGISEETASRFRVPVGSPIVGQVFASQQRAVINTSEEMVAHCHGSEAEFFVSVPMIATTLSTAEQPVGVLTITDRHRNRPFEPWEQESIDLLANMAGSAIHDLLTRQSRDEARDSIVVALATLAEYRDYDTGRHVERVTQFCLRLAKELQATGTDNGQIDETFLHDFKRAAPLHDIGKVAIPDAILLKPGPLTPEERAVMQTHTTIGRDAIRSVIKRSAVVAFLQMAGEIALSHHEWYDGSGYPMGLIGQEIPLAARILGVADVYDAITSRRVYREAMPHEHAVSIIAAGSGTQFDPIVAEAFLRCQHDIGGLAAEMADDGQAAPSPIAGDDRGRSAA